MEWVMAGVLVALVVVAGGVFVAVDRWITRDLKRQMDRLIFPLYHQNRELRLRNQQLRAELGLGEDEEL
jgi:hypothetical protein